MRLRSIPLLCLLLLALGACRSGVENDPILQLSAEESLVQGKSWMEQGKYGKARDYLTHAFEVEPNSRTGREALLLAADSYYLDGGVANFIQAEAKYRDFLNRFPTSEQAAYAQFQIANSLAKRISKPDRDQTATMNALQAYQDLMRLYPTSRYAEEAAEQIKVVEENLASHELVVGSFNYRFKNYRGAIERLEGLIETYPGFSRLDEALYYLGQALKESRDPKHWVQAEKTFDRLREEHPESRFVAKIPDWELPEIPVEDPEEAEEGGEATAAEGGDATANEGDFR